jgi:hypothetical protein
MEMSIFVSDRRRLELIKMQVFIDTNVKNFSLNTFKN